MWGDTPYRREKNIRGCKPLHPNLKTKVLTPNIYLAIGRLANFYGTLDSKMLQVYATPVWGGHTKLNAQTKHDT